MSDPHVRLLLPALRRWPQPWPRALALALGRADVSTLDADAALARSLGLSAMPASAALARLGEGDLSAVQVRAHRWLRADPAGLRADINGARLLGVGPMLLPDDEDLAALAAPLRELFAPESLVLDTPHPARWYLRLPLDAELPCFSTPVAALGEDVFDHRPQGVQARRWRRLDSEAQVLLHQSPRNGLRAAAGRAPINALWFWGEADLPDATKAGLPGLASEDVLLRGAARLASIEPAAPPTQWPHAARGLYDLRGVALERLPDAWLLPALAALRERRMTMQWICEEGPVFALRHAQSRRFWRRLMAPPSIDAPAP